MKLQYFALWSLILKEDFLTVTLLELLYSFSLWHDAVFWWGVSFMSLVPPYSIQPGRSTHLDRTVWLAAFLLPRWENFLALLAMFCILNCPKSEWIQNLKSRDGSKMLSVLSRLTWPAGMFSWRWQHFFICESLCRFTNHCKFYGVCFLVHEEALSCWCS